jgi:Spy/CpxP family protein refolding chaperone
MKRLLIGVLVVLPAVAWAEDLKDPFEAMYSPKRLLRGAALTEAQLAQIRELRRAGRPQEKAIEKEIETLGDEFKDSFTSEAPLDAAHFASVLQRMDRLNEELDRLKVVNMLKIRALLTREQLASVARAHQKMKDIERRTKEIEDLKRDLDSQRRALGPTIAGENEP